MAEPMLDTKTILLVIALTGGTNALQFLGITAPAETAKAELTANSDMIRDELSICLNELRECYRNCPSAYHDHGVEID